MYFKYILSILAISLAFNSSATPTLTASNSNHLTIREALNKAMEQQILSQRIAKVYLALNNNVYEPQFYQERDEAIQLFQETLEELKYYTPNTAIKEAYNSVQVTWDEYKKIAHWSINKKGAEKLLSQCEGMLSALEHLVNAYEEYAQELGDMYKNSALIDVIQLIRETGKQRMLTQRIMLFYLAAKQDIQQEYCIGKLQTTAETYNHLISKLADAAINSPEIQVEINEIKKYWTTLSNYIKFFNDDDAYINSMLLIANELTQKSNKLAVMYHEIGKKLSISKLLNLISYQNMLTQRIAKAYVAITYKYSIPKYKRELEASIDLFEEQINTLKRSAPTEEIKEAIRVVNVMWKNYRDLALDWKKLDDIKVGKLLEKSHIIMATCDQVAAAIETYAQTIPEYQLFYQKKGKEVSHDNNIAQQVRQAGLQRVYSQRVVVYFIMNALGKDTQLSQERLNQCLNKYQEGHKLLSNSSLNTMHINQVLHGSDKEWTIIADASKNASTDNVLSILEHSDLLFLKLDKVNNLYEGLMNKLITQ